MKFKKIVKLSIRKGPVSRKTSTVKPAGAGVVEIFHQQALRQSRNYNSAEATYGIRAFGVSDDPEAIAARFSELELTVEGLMALKFKQHGRVLESL